PDGSLRHPRPRRGPDAGGPHHPPVRPAGTTQGGLRGSAGTPGGCRRPAGGSRVRTAVLAYLAFARRRIPQDEGGVKLMASKQSSTTVLLWRVAILLLILAVWQWGYDLRTFAALKP